MKITKILVLAATAAMAAMAFIGATTASANTTSVVLCKNAELVCENPWPNPTTIVGHATNPKLLSSIGTVECEKSLAEITLINKLDKLIFAHILSLSFEGNCHLGSTKCTVTVQELGGISITHGPNALEWLGVATTLPLGETSMVTKANVKCGFLINCTYEGGEETETKTINGGEGEATVVAENAELKRSAGFCPEVSKWDATYVGLGTGLWLES